MKKTSFYIVAGIILIPVLIYITLSKSRQVYKKLPVLGPKSWNGNDTDYFTCPNPYNFFQIHNPKQAQSIFITTFLTDSLQQVEDYYNWLPVYDRFSEFSEIRFTIVHSFDWNSRILPKISKADTSILSLRKWNKQNIDSAVSMFIPSSENNIIRQATSFFVLSDKAQHIRGVYLSDAQGMKDLKDELKVLLYEYHEPGK